MKLPAALLLVLPLLVAGCVGGADDSGDDTATTPTPTHPPQHLNQTGGHDNHPLTKAVRLSGAYPVNIRFDPSEITVEAGRNITIQFTNNDQTPTIMHDWVLEGVEGAKTEMIAPGESDDASFPAPPVGSYKFFCSVGDHRSRGMEGNFIVE